MPTMLKTFFYRAASFVRCPIDRGVIDPGKVYPSFSSVREVYAILSILF